LIGRHHQDLNLNMAEQYHMDICTTHPFGQAAHADWDMIRDAGFVLEAADGSPYTASLHKGNRLYN
jgi:biotin synthase